MLPADAVDASLLSAWGLPRSSPRRWGTMRAAQTGFAPERCRPCRQRDDRIPCCQLERLGANAIKSPRVSYLRVAGKSLVTFLVT